MRIANGMNQGAEFAAPWGMTLKVISIGASAVLCGVSGWVWLYASTPVFMRWLIPSLPLSVLVPCGLFTVRGYVLAEGALHIRRLCWSTRLSLAGLRAVQAVPGAMRNSVRLFGNGGLFAFTGWFRNRTLGTYRAYVTDLNRLVVLRFEKRVVVISPDEPARFVGELQRYLAPGFRNAYLPAPPQTPHPAKL